MTLGMERGMLASIHELISVFLAFWNAASLLAEFAPCYSGYCHLPDDRVVRCQHSPELRAAKYGMPDRDMPTRAIDRCK